MLTLKASYDLARTYGFTSLITTPEANAKLAKSTGFYNAGITLAQGNLSGHEMCPEKGWCYGVCLGGTGRAEFTPNIVKSRIARTKLYATDIDAFWAVLEPQLHAVDRSAKRLGVPVAFRPNILSDQSWHVTLPQLFTEFPHWQFYSYTKVKSKIEDKIADRLPQNYHVTYSWSERSDLQTVKRYLRDGINTAVAFYDNELRPGIPTEWQGLPVFDADTTDLRFLDPIGIAGLKAKLPKSRRKQIRAIKLSRGFFQQYSDGSIGAAHSVSRGAK